VSFSQRFLSIYIEKANEHAQNGHFDEYIAEVSKVIIELNRYWSLVQPWNFESTQQGKEKLQTVLYMSFEGIRIATLLLQPIMPLKCKMLLDRLGIPLEERSFDNAVLDGCTVKSRRMEPMEPLFPKINEYE
jgi:methionyl-tRNA synthetase